MTTDGVADRPGRLVFRCVGAGRIAAVFVAVPLTLLALVALALGDLWSLLLIALAVLTMSSWWQRAVLDERELLVQGRLTRRRVDLALLEQTGADRTHTVWVAARGQKPFRVLFVPAVDGTTQIGAPTFVHEVRRRAAALGAAVDVDAAARARPPRGTSPFFSF